MTYKQKRVAGHFYEIKDSGVTGWYGLFCDGMLVEQSADYNYILGRFDSI